MGFNCDFLERKIITEDGVDLNTFDYYLCRHDSAPPPPTEPAPDA